MNKHYATYSRSNDCFSSNCPDVFTRASGCHVTADDGREFIDFGMALRSVILGYCYPKVDDAVKKAIDKGISFTRSNPYEGELKELLKAIIPCCEEVKFGKNGSDATSAAVKLARAYTGKDIVLIPEECPFFSTWDWFIADTPVSDGIPWDDSTRKYSYNKMTCCGVDLEKILKEESHNIAAIILDPATVDITKEKLQYIRGLCDKYGMVMILDEVISGFRYSLNGVQGLYGVVPDLCTLGKAMGNGYSISALCGRKELFDLGLRDKGNVFLLSGTYFSETTGLAASIATIKELMEWHSFASVGDRMKPSLITAHDKLKATGGAIIAFTREYIKKNGLEEHVSIGGFPACPMMKWKDLRLKTIFDWKMIENGILMPYIAPSLSHDANETYKTLDTIDDAMSFVKYALTGDLDKFIDANCRGHVERPIFRRC
ncbi:MAG: aminotransferase class III-fold pyridoxal phosphate-dependent enzyme [Phycisphaerae bacterium]|nr:aminotransferase class III-fold pyridoxal phosphate-dependent enzyme [Phycisphaerae bacterium]MDD5239925.1 aminotransferase class III-fold pyridoxal phosphate-dependent enzyme [Candidatus Nanoarchaeia archaeon]